MNAVRGVDLDIHCSLYDPEVDSQAVFEFIRRELEKGQDIEMGYYWDGCLCGHMVTVVGIRIDEDADRAYVYVVDPGDGQGTSVDPHILIYTGELSSGELLGPIAYGTYAVAESPKKPVPPRLDIHPTYIDGWLLVQATVFTEPVGPVIIDTSYVQVCRDYRRWIPVWNTGVEIEFTADDGLDRRSHHEPAVPYYDFEDSTWYMDKLEEYLYVPCRRGGIHLAAAGEFRRYGRRYLRSGETRRVVG
jgi:hypothetical protein